MQKMPLSYRFSAWFHTAISKLISTLCSPIFWLSVGAFCVTMALLYGLFSMVMQYDTHLRFFGVTRARCRDLPDIDLMWLIYCWLFAFLSIFYAAGEVVTYTRRLASAKNDPFTRNPLFLASLAFLAFLAFMGLSMYLIQRNCT